MRSLPSSSEEAQGEQTKAKARASRAQIDVEISTATRVYERVLHTTTTTTQRNATQSNVQHEQSWQLKIYRIELNLATCFLRYIAHRPQ